MMSIYMYACNRNISEYLSYIVDTFMEQEGMQVYCVNETYIMR